MTRKRYHDTEPISEKAWENLKREAEYYYEKITNIRQGASFSCNDILGNLSVPLCEIVTYNEREDAGDKMRIYKWTDSNLPYIKCYFTLLQTYPDFARGELSKGRGAFPDIHKSMFDHKALTVR